MLSNLKKLSVAMVAAVALTLLAGSAAQAQVQNRYGLVTIKNPTAGVTITYSIKWGNGEWMNFTLKPGTSMHHYWRFNFVNENRTPAFAISFESGVNVIRGVQTFNLTPYASPRMDAFGKEYSFLQLNDGVSNLVTLRADN